MKKEKISTIKNNIYFLKLIWKICPGRVLGHFFAKLWSFAMWVFYSVVFMQYLFGAGDGIRDFASVVIFIWGVVLLQLLSSLFNEWFYRWYSQKTDIIIHKKLNLMLFEKANAVDISCYETPEFYNSYTRAATEASGRASAVLNHCATVISALLSSVFVTVTMVRITPWSLVCIALPLIGNLMFGKKLSRVFYDRDQEAVPSNRKKDYVNRIVYFRKYAGELRMTNVFSVLRNIYSSAIDEGVDIERKYAPKRFILECPKYILMFVLGFQGMWLFAAYLALSGEIGLSELIVLLNAIVSVSWMMQNLETALSNTITNALFIENLKKFFDYVPKIDEAAKGKMPPKNVETVEFKNVSFAYDGQDGFALKDINLVLKRGVRHALVGINGSGKSTFIKLLLRFYDPADGEILLNGTDIREYDIKEYRKLIGAAFQDFALFAATVSENVLLRELCSDYDRKQVITALKNSDAFEKIDSLKYKENTMLTREFDNEGAELSGGERQKLAIARAFAKQSPIVVLDEPSSALDPIAEYRMFETITELCKGEERISVIVSHRLSSAAMCDWIFVFENGRLLEQGAHRALLSENGAYAEMFKMQARNYQTYGGEICE